MYLRTDRRLPALGAELSVQGMLPWKGQNWEVFALALRLELVVTHYRKPYFIVPKK